MTTLTDELLERLMAIRQMLQRLQVRVPEARQPFILLDREIQKIRKTHEAADRQE